MKNHPLLDFSEYFSQNVIANFLLNPGKQSREEIIEDLGLNTQHMAIPEQVHGSVVEFVNLPQKYSGADSLITTNSDTLLTLKVADCVPVFILDPISKMIALIHSGWRGTVNGIMVNSIKLMKKNCSNVQNLEVYLGPAIGKCCYEVNSEVADKFEKHTKVKLELNKWKVDLHGQIRTQLVEMGLLANKITNSTICTYESTECHSYRRDGQNAGRMYAVFGLK